MLDFFPLRVSLAEFSANRQKRGGALVTDPGDSRRKPAVKHNLTSILLLMKNSETREYLWNLLTENLYFPIAVKDQKELLHSVQQGESAIILIDCSAVTAFGARILSKIKVACRSCRVIIFCNKSHLSDKSHRELIKDILDIGVYACILTPYQDWEILSMISCYAPR
jgi:DNA-binding NarL/FixJ family response regulator